jgi:branched-chain amino acid transport system permease protein
VPGLFEISMEGMANYYYFVLVVGVLAIYAFYRIIRSPFGLTLQGIRDSESRIAFAGISVRNYRLMAFVIAGLYAGLAGALLTPLERTVTPTVAHWSHGANALLAALLGGTFTFAGPIVGAFLMFMIKDIVVRFTEYWLFVVGAVVVVLVMAFRGGVVSVVTEVLLPRLARAPAVEKR